MKIKNVKNVHIYIIFSILICIFFVIAIFFKIKSLNKASVKVENDDFKYGYSNPVVPEGFQKIDTKTTKWENMTTDYMKGLVIQDEYGNQFVWVPIFGNIKYEKWCKFGLPYDYTEDISENNAEIVKSIKKYDGFYIARFESSFVIHNQSIKAASIKSKNKVVANNWSKNRSEQYNGYLWNYINFADAKKYASNMANDYGYDDVTTFLVNGYAWDSVLRWFVASSDIDMADSRSYGNYYNSISPANIPRIWNNANFWL